MFHDLIFFFWNTYEFNWRPTRYYSETSVISTFYGRHNRRPVYQPTGETVQPSPSENSGHTAAFRLLLKCCCVHTIYYDDVLLSRTLLGTISRRTYQRPTSSPTRKITAAKTADPTSVLANLITFGYVSSKIVYSKWKR